MSVKMSMPEEIRAKRPPAPPPKEEKKPKKSANDAFMEKIKKRFQQASSDSSDNRRNYIEDTEFSCSQDQWSPEVKRIRGAHRPALTFNRLNPVVKQIIGDYRQNKLSIKVLPASGDASEETAEILAGIIRNIEAQSNADVAYTTALECSARGGFGYFRILNKFTGDDSFDTDLVIEPIQNPLTVYFDPSAKKITREDAGWCFVTERMSKEAFEEMYPDAEPINFQGSDDWFTQDSVRVAEYYEKKKYEARLGAFSNGMVIPIEDDSEIEALAQIGIRLVKERTAERTKILWKKLNGAQVLEEEELMIRYIPVIPVIGEEVNLEGKVYTRSAIFYAKDAQRMYNYSKTAATESISLASKTPWLVTPEHIQGFQDQWDNANISPAPYLVYNHDGSQPPPQRLEPPSQPIGEMSMAVGASDDIKATTGLYDSSLGGNGQEVSGVAIARRQNEGNTATYIFIDNLKKAIEYAGRILIDFIPSVYDTERVVRVLDMEGEPGTETVNEHKYDPITGITEVLNSITVGKYDVVVSTGPNFASQQAEMLNTLQQILPALPIIGQTAPDLIVKALPFRGADQIAARIRRSLPPQITVDPDSPEGQAMANQPPPVPPEVQQQQAEAERKDKEFAATMALKEKELEGKLALSAQEIESKEELAEREFARDSALENKKFAFEQTMANKKLAIDERLLHVNADLDIKKHIIKTNAEQQTHERIAEKPAVNLDMSGALAPITEALHGLAQQHIDATHAIHGVVASVAQAADQHGKASHEAISHLAGAMKEHTGAVKENTAAVKAPRKTKAIRDGNGRIVGSESYI